MATSFPLVYCIYVGMFLGTGRKFGPKIPGKTWPGPSKRETRRGTKVYIPSPPTHFTQDSNPFRSNNNLLAPALHLATKKPWEKTNQKRPRPLFIIHVGWGYPRRRIFCQAHTQQFAHKFLPFAHDFLHFRFFPLLLRKPAVNCGRWEGVYIYPSAYPLSHSSGRTFNSSDLIV